MRAYPTGVLHDIIKVQYDFRPTLILGTYTVDDLCIGTRGTCRGKLDSVLKVAQAILVIAIGAHSAATDLLLPICAPPPTPSLGGCSSPFTRILAT